MSDWIKSLRLSVCVFASLLVFVSFKICNKTFANCWILGSAVLVIACATMVHNDWRDRIHDVKKGKMLASSKPKKFLVFDISIWVIAFGISIAASLQVFCQSLLLWAAIASGLIYSETRRVPLVPIFMVSFTSASVTLFPIFQGGSSFRLWLFFLAILVTIFGREIVKDLEDVSVDTDYKWTLPQKIGTRKCEIIASISILVGFMFMVAVSLASLVWFPLVLASVYFLVFENKYQTSKTFADAGVGLAIATLYITA